MEVSNFKLNPSFITFVERDKFSGKYDVDAVTPLASKVDALAQRVDKVGAFPISGRSSGPLVRV